MIILMVQLHYVQTVFQLPCVKTLKVTLAKKTYIDLFYLIQEQTQNKPLTKVNNFVQLTGATATVSTLATVVGQPNTPGIRK